MSDRNTDHFGEVMATNPPRLVVQFQRGPGGEEGFQWGVVGSIPILSLIGQIDCVQADLVNNRWIQDYGEPADQPPSLVIVWDDSDRSLEHFLHPAIPVTPLVGMLETVKAMLVGSRLAAQAASQLVEPRLFVPDGIDRKLWRP